jgi:prophage DNA circulation protein
MSRQPVIKNWQGASFKGIDFSKYVTEWSDTRQLGLATHQYLKRRGAENEDMGRDPHVVHVVLSYTGPTWFDDFMALIAALEQGAKGPLVHPLFGQMRAACRGFQDARMNVEQAADLYVVPLVFIEDSVDTTLELPTSQGPSAQQQQIIG